MTNEEKIALFEKEIAYMEIENIKDFFKKAINICKQMNYSVFKSEKYNAYYAELMQHLATKQA